MDVSQESKLFTRQEIQNLILATYRMSFPYLLVFILGLLLATWVFTEIIF